MIEYNPTTFIDDRAIAIRRRLFSVSILAALTFVFKANINGVLVDLVSIERNSFALPWFFILLILWLKAEFMIRVNEINQSFLNQNIKGFDVSFSSYNLFRNYIQFFKRFWTIKHHKNDESLMILNANLKEHHKNIDDDFEISSQAKLIEEIYSSPEVMANTEVYYSSIADVRSRHAQVVYFFECLMPMIVGWLGITSLILISQNV